MMRYDAEFNRRGWLRSVGLATGAAGILSLSENSALGAQITDGKTLGVFNVMDYGAKGDSKAEDSDAIQNAINAAQNFRNGGIVFLPTGSYLVSKGLLITGRVKILGQGQATIDGATHIVPTSLDFDVIKAVGVNYGIVLEGFTIRSYSDKGAEGHFLRFQDCQHVRVNGVSLSNFWNGALVDSSGDVVFCDMSLGPADVPGAGRFGIKCTAASKGNPNATQAWNCCVSQWGQNQRTVDGFVLANGYNSFTTVNCGALNCNRAFYSTKDGGVSPNFFVVHLGTSDHCNTAVQLDDGGYNQFSDFLVTSSSVDNVNIGANVTGPVAFSNCIVTMTGSKTPPHGAGYRIFSVQAPNVTITGGTVYNTGGNAVAISGNANVVITGVAISSIQSGEGANGADGVSISGSGNITLTGLSIVQVRDIAIHVLAGFTGTLTFSGISQQNAARGLYDDGSSGQIVGNGSFRINFNMDTDVSKNRNAKTCIQSHDSIPCPFYPTPAVPGSGSPVLNTTGTNCMVYILGGSLSRVVVDGVNLGVQASVYLPVNRKIEIKYSGMLSWVWQRVT
jgi:hypothetical protein